MQELLKNNACSERVLNTVDIRVKLFISFFISLTTIMMHSLEAQLFLLLASTCYVYALGRVLHICYGYILVCLLTAFAYGLHLLILYIIPGAPHASFISFLMPFLRIVIMINVLLPLAFSTRFEELLNLFKSLSFPVVIYTPLVVVIRFIPAAIVDIKQIMEAIRIRGYTLTCFYCIKHPRTVFRLFFIPMIFRIIMNAENLAISAELKGIGKNKHISIYKKTPWKRRDSSILILFLCVLIIAFIISWNTSSVPGITP